MTWDSVLKIVAAALTSVGGIGAVIIITIKWSAGIIAKRLEERYSLKLSKELETYKSKIESKTYISKTKFDAEFKLYQELSKAFFDAVKTTSIMIPCGLTHYPADTDLHKKLQTEQYKEAVRAITYAQDTLKSNIPFISKDIYELYADILKDCQIQLIAFERQWDKFSQICGESELKGEDYQRTENINKKFDSVNEKVREYISGLDVLE